MSFRAGFALNNERPEEDPPVMLLKKFVRPPVKEINTAYLEQHQV